MSPFKRSRLRVSVESDQIALVKLGGLRLTSIESECLLPIALDIEQPQAGLCSLQAALDTGEWNASMADVVLSDQLVRYFVFEVIPGIQGIAELKQLVAARFEDIFGLPAAEWEINADLTPFSSAFLVCAVDRRLLAELRRLFAGSALPLNSIQPYLVREFNHWRRHLRTDLTWFAAAERNSVTVALLARNSWHGLRTHRIGGDVHRVLPMLLARDQVAHGIATPTFQVWLTGDATVRQTGQVSPAVTVTSLGRPAWRGNTEQWSRDYRVALAGIWT